MSLTRNLITAVSLVSLGAFQYGFHLAELNAPQDVITCNISDDSNYDCIPMTSYDIGLVNSLYSVGGFLSATIAGSIADKLGRKRASLANCIILALGSLLIASATSVSTMSIGRFFAGLGAGSSIVVTPIYLSEISPDNWRGTIGGMSQILVNTGIFIAQALGVVLSDKSSWRKILYCGVWVALLNGIMLLFCVESPKWLAANGRSAESRDVLIWLRESSNVDDEIAQWKLSNRTHTTEDQGLLGSQEAETSTVAASEFFTNLNYRKPLIACIGIMIAQQSSGINSIIFYGSSVLRDSIPQFASVMSCLISLINLMVTIFVSPFIDRYGRRALLLLSITGMAIFATVLAVGMEVNYAVLSCLGAACYIVAFALGMGPIPFLLISELVPSAAAGIAQSAATTASWLSTFIIAYFFPVLHSILGAHVFFIFSVTCVLGLLFIKKFVPETQGKSYKQVWERY